MRGVQQEQNIARHEWREQLAGSLGWVCLVLAHCLWIDLAPAWHLDEAWAGLYAHRIATEPGFWPIQAMVPYTFAWPHYWAALFFKIFGTCVATYRAAGQVAVITGIFLIAESLRKAGEKKAAYFLPGVIAFFPALVINQRWVIDMNTFHVLCVGLFSLGLVTRWKNGSGGLAYVLMGTGGFFGVTSHVVFLGPLLAVWLCLFICGKLERKSDRLFIVTLLISFYPLLAWIFTHSSDPSQVVRLAAILTVLAAAQGVPPRFWASHHASSRLDSRRSTLTRNSTFNPFHYIH